MFETLGTSSYTGIGSGFDFLLQMNRDQPDGSLAASMTSGSESVEWGNLYYPLGQVSEPSSVTVK